jgi:hypothetical protein
MMDGFMQLVKDMRAAQKEYFSLRHRGEQPSTVRDALQRSKALERRVDEEIAAADRQDQTTDPDCIRMANGQKLVQGSLF